MKTVYADNAATTALCPEALDAMVDCLKNNYGNASSLHHMGQEAAAAVLQARRDIADAIGADVNEIYFTSGGTEADNWAITNAAHLGEKKGKKHIISTTFEHHAVLHTLMKLEKEGFEVTYLDVHEDGYVRLDEFKKALYALGETPLPHSIINRPVEEEDAVRFQSIFARVLILLILRCMPVWATSVISM